MLDLAEIPGATPPHACETLRLLAARVPAGEAIVEIGVYLGRSVCYLGKGAKEGNGARVWGIDPWDLPGERRTYANAEVGFTDPQTRKKAGEHVVKAELSDIVTLVRGFAGEIGRTWTGPPVGLMYVDGDHHEAVIRADFDAWQRHIARDATIVFDDHEPAFPGVVAAVAAMVAEGRIRQPMVLHGRLAITSLA